MTVSRSDEAAIEVAGLAKTYGHGTRALDGVDLTVERGETVVLLGANGSGKSTLLKSLTRLVEPTAGTVLLHGDDVTRAKKKRLAQIRREVGVVFQNINLVNQLSVLTNVIHGSLGRASSTRNWFAATAHDEQRHEAMDALQRVGLTAVADRRAEQLSGGQRQRVAVARMLMQRPRIVLADEPVAALDPRAGRAIMDLLWEIAGEQGLTLVCSLHQLHLARAYAHRVVALRDGRIDIDAPIGTLEDAALEGLYTTDDEEVFA